MERIAVTEAIFREDGSYKEHAVIKFVNIEELTDEAKELIEKGDYELEYIDSEVCVTNYGEVILKGAMRI